MTHAGVRKLTVNIDAVGENTAPLTQNPPPVDEQTRNQIAEAAANDGSADPKVKTEKESMWDTQNPRSRMTQSKQSFRS